jgi:hypothetical protein
VDQRRAARECGGYKYILTVPEPDWPALSRCLRDRFELRVAEAERQDRRANERVDSVAALVGACDGRAEPSQRDRPERGQLDLRRLDWSAMLHRWRCLGLVAALALFAALVPSAASARKFDARYCAPGGDFCESVFDQHGSRYIGVYVSSDRRIRLCITAPSGTRTCRELRLRDDGDGTYSLIFRWASRFPHQQQGTYVARFSKNPADLFPRAMAFRSFSPKTVRKPKAATPFAASSDAPIGSGPLQRRPGSIVYSGDGAAFLAGAGSTRAHLQWQRYTVHGARATGADWRNNCDPDCADGTFSPYSMSVHLYRPQPVGGFHVFTRMTVHYAGIPPAYPGSQVVTFRLKFASSYGTFFWNP